MKEREFRDIISFVILLIIGLLIAFLVDKLLGILLLLISLIPVHQEVLKILQRLINNSSNQIKQLTKQKIEHSPDSIQANTAGNNSPVFITQLSNKKRQGEIENEENLENRRNHFNNLKENVLKIWYKHLSDKPTLGEAEYICEVYISKSHEIDETLFRDIRNHFPQIIKEWDNLNSKYEEYKRDCKNFVDEVLKIIKNDTFIEDIYGWSAKLIYEKILDRDTKLLEPNPILEDYDYNTIKSKSNTYTYAQDSKKENLEKFILSLNNIIKSDSFCEKTRLLDKESKDIMMMSEKFKENLNKIIHSEKQLTGKCQYI